MSIGTQIQGCGPNHMGTCVDGVDCPYKLKPCDAYKTECNVLSDTDRSCCYPMIAGKPIRCNNKPVDSIPVRK